MTRDALSQTEKYLGFKKAYDTFKTYQERGEFLAAYVVAFSIFEDRLTACFLLAHDLAGKRRPAGHITLYRRVGFLQTAGHVSGQLADAWRRAGDERNRNLHAAMWRIDAVTDSMCETALTAAREANRISKRLKRSPNAAPR